MPFRLFNFSRDRHVDPPTQPFLLIKTIESNKNIKITLFLHPQNCLDRRNMREKERKKKVRKSFQNMKMKTIFYKSMFETILKDVGCVRSVILDVGCVRSAMLDQKVVWKMQIIL